MTDRDVYEHFYRRYEAPDTTGEIEAWERRREEAEAAYSQKPLDQRKADFWSMCREYGCSEADTQAQWDAYLKGG